MPMIKNLIPRNPKAQITHYRVIEALSEGRPTCSFALILDIQVGSFVILGLKDMVGEMVLLMGCIVLSMSLGRHYFKWKCFYCYAT